MRAAHGKETNDAGAPKDVDASLHVICFELDGRPFGIPIGQVAEVVELLPVTPLFRMPEWVLGVVGLRGDILEVLDVGPLLGLRPARVSAASRLVVVQADRRRWAILVERVDGARVLERVAPVAGAREALPSWAAQLARKGDYVATLLDMEAFAREVAVESTKLGGQDARREE